MKSKLKTELHAKPLDELKNILTESLKTAHLLKVNLSKEKNLRLYKAKRKEIAIIKTIIKEKQL